MNKLMHSIRAIAFWGIVFLIIFVFIFKINIQEIVDYAWKSNESINNICKFMLLSIPLYPISEALSELLFKYNIEHKYHSNYIFDFSLGSIAQSLYSYLIMPFHGFNIKPIIRALKKDTDKSGIGYDLSLMIWDILLMILWWSFVYYTFLSIKESKDLINRHFNFTTIGAIKLIGFLFLIYLYLLSILKIMIDVHNYNFRMKESYLDSFKSSTGTRAQQYFDRNILNKPSICRSCGGPFPECMSSCKAFDN